jgi:uncharacterized membrane protein YhaH (DUF805 family)
LSPSIRRVFDLKTYLSFKGRIGRQTYWLSAIFFIAVLMLSQYLIALLLGFPMLLPRDSADVQKYVILYHQNALLHVASNFIAILPLSALNIKRLKDRGRSPWWVLPIFTPEIARVLLSVTGAAMTPLLADTGFVYEVPTPLADFLRWSDVAISLLVFVDLGLLRGTEGANQYGDDTLA